MNSQNSTTSTSSQIFLGAALSLARIQPARRAWEGAFSSFLTCRSYRDLLFCSSSGAVPESSALDWTGGLQPPVLFFYPVRFVSAILNLQNCGQSNSQGFRFFRALFLPLRGDARSLASCPGHPGDTTRLLRWVPFSKGFANCRGAALSAMWIRITFIRRSPPYGKTH